MRFTLSVSFWMIGAVSVVLMLSMTFIKARVRDIETGHLQSLLRWSQYSKQGVVEVFYETNGQASVIRVELHKSVVRGSNVRSAGQVPWHHISAVRALRFLNLQGWPISEDEVRTISGHSGIEYLNLAGTSLPESVAVDVATSLPQLRWLVASEGMIGPTGLTKLRKHRPNVTVHLLNNSLHDACVRSWGTIAVAQSRSNDIREILRALEQSRPGKELRTTTLKRIGPFPNGQVRMPLSPDALVQFSVIPDALVIDLSYTECSDDHFAHLPGLSRVLFLSVAGSNVSTTTRRLCDFPDLMGIHVDDSQLDDIVIDNLSKLRRLEWVTVDCSCLPCAKMNALHAMLPTCTILFRMVGQQNWTRQQWVGPAWADCFDSDSGTPARRLSAFLSARHAYLTSSNTWVIPYLSHIATLNSVTVSGDVPLNTEVFNELAENPAIACLELSARQCAPSMLSALRGKQHVEELNCDCSIMDDIQIDEVVQAVATLPRLQRLTFRNARLSIGQVKRLAAIPCLSSVSFLKCFQDNDTALVRSCFPDNVRLACD